MTKPLLTFTPMLLLLCVVCLPLTSCVTTSDPEYKNLTPHADNSPNANDIVGSWHQKHGNAGPLSGEGGKYNRSLMFLSNGTGQWYQNRKPLLPVNLERKGSMKWEYDGAGAWTTDNIFSGWNLTFRITKDKKNLLLKMTDQYGTTLAVFRQE